MSFLFEQADKLTVALIQRAPAVITAWDLCNDIELPLQSFRHA